MEIIFNRDGTYYRINSVQPFSKESEDSYLEVEKLYTAAGLLPTEKYETWDKESICQEYFDFVAMPIPKVKISDLQKEIEERDRQIAQMTED